MVGGKKSYLDQEARNNIPGVSKKVDTFEIFYQVKMRKIFGKLSYVWMAKCLVYHMTSKHLKIAYASVSTGHFC